MESQVISKTNNKTERKVEFIMKQYNVTVNGVTYEVMVEEVGATATYTAPAAPVAAPAAAPAPAPAPAAAPAAAPVATPAGATEVKAPMPGTIMKLNVAVGDTVKKGDIICILEAMKMENEIFAPIDGTVAAISVAKGASVQTDEVIAAIKA
jgi:glutaconyl-CoA decarboxylase